jgi:hypothetical protein
MKKCATKYCNRKPEGNRQYCSTCRSRKCRQNNILKYTYNNLKSNSTRRGVEFTLTIEDFKKICYETNYIQGKGKSKLSYSIDRIDNSKGYVLENIRILTLSENSRKGSKILEYDWYTGYATVVNHTKYFTNNSDNPF